MKIYFFCICATYIIALCVSLCLASSQSNEESARELIEHVLRIPHSEKVSSLTNDESARDFIEQVLRIPNQDKVLNTVLGRLETNRQGLLVKERVAEVDCEEPHEALPEYTESLESSRERSLRQLGGQKHYPICHLERKIRRLNTNEYEYRPAYYEETRCIPTNKDTIGVTNEICSSLGFSCVQWNKTIHLTRRRYSSDCWETRTLVIPAGCECMWPVHRLGDINLHV